jgi:hypothetical protein
MGAAPLFRPRALRSPLLAAAALLAGVLALHAIAPARADSSGRLRVVIAVHPKAKSAGRTAHLRWSVNRRVRSARCRLDGRRPRPCGRRLVYRRLRPGRHRFRVTVTRRGRRARAVVSWVVRRKPRPRPSEPSSSPSPPTGTAIWSAGMEGGSLAEWYAPESGPSGSFGGGEYNSGGADTVASTERAHSGSWSAKATIFSGSGGTRLFRWRELRQNQDLLFETWFFIPAAYRLTADPSYGRYWDIFQYKSRSTSGAVDPIWYLDLQKRADGSLAPHLIWWHRTLEGPELGQLGFRRFQPAADVSFPVGRWVSVKARLRQSRDFDGVLQFWIDGRLVYDKQNVRTSYSNCSYNSWCGSNEWSVNNYSDGLDPALAPLYIDDARITK